MKKFKFHILLQLPDVDGTTLNTVLFGKQGEIATVCSRFTIISSRIYGWLMQVSKGIREMKYLLGLGTDVKVILDMLLRKQLEHLKRKLFHDNGK